MKAPLAAAVPMLGRYALCAALVLLLEATPSLGDWSVQPVGEGVAARIRTDSTGAPHIAVSNSGFRYSTLVGDAWEERSVLPFADDIALDHNDNVFFLDTPSPDFFPTLQVLLGNGLSLTTEIVGHRIGELEFLGFDSENRPHIAYNNTSTQQLIHNRWTGESWEARVVATDARFRFGNPGFDSFLDSSGQAHFAWRNDAGVLRYSDPTSSGWITSTPFPTLDARIVDLAVDEEGVAHMAYDVFTGFTLTGGLHYANNASGGAWQGDRIPKAKSSGATRASLVLDDHGRPNLFDYESPFTGPVDLVHYLLDDGQWESTILHTHAEPQFSGPDQIEAAFDGANLHVLFSTGDSDVYYAVQEPDPLLGDYNNDGAVNAADYTVWRDGASINSGQAGYNLWASNYGATAAGAASQTVPEPTAVATLLLACIGAMNYARR
ncbi:hypothetical protein [Botrimarina mediterranea]|uniref:hypothetical protein n=1 Tax=Botrimarina mediterranea TaxID=2528022 RepID=UPI00118C4677|nr:hypothetical protein K2D_39100 [Planctomycetes bacterium K2D]